MIFWSRIHLLSIEKWYHGGGKYRDIFLCHHDDKSISQDKLDTLMQTRWNDSTEYIQGHPKSKVKTVGMFITTKDISNPQGPIDTFRSISPHVEVLVPLKARTIILFGWIKESSMLMHFRVITGQTFKADPLPMSIRGIIIPLHSTAMFKDLIFPIRSGLSSSSL